jgi:hypothetical protein
VPEVRLPLPFQQSVAQNAWRYDPVGRSPQVRVVAREAKNPFRPIAVLCLQTVTVSSLRQTPKRDQFGRG